MKNFFQLCNSFIGEVYFRISRDFGIMPSEVIRKKFTPDMKFLILKYSEQIRQEIDEARKMKEELDKQKSL